MIRRDIIVNGLRYTVGTPDPYFPLPAHLKGFAGRRYTIRFHDGATIKTDDLRWDYSFKNHSRPDTAIILAGWTVTPDTPKCVWQDAGPFQVFGPRR